MVCEDVFRNFWVPHTRREQCICLSFVRAPLRFGRQCHRKWNTMVVWTRNPVFCWDIRFQQMEFDATYKASQIYLGVVNVDGSFWKL